MQGFVADRRAISNCAVPDADVVPALDEDKRFASSLHVTLEARTSEQFAFEVAKKISHWPYRNNPNRAHRRAYRSFATALAEGNGHALIPRCRSLRTTRYTHPTRITFAPDTSAALEKLRVDAGHAVRAPRACRNGSNTPEQIGEPTTTPETPRTIVD